MRQCQGTTTSGRPCRRQVAPGTRYCTSHSTLDLERLVKMGVGAVVGNALLPGAGLLLGAVGGRIADHVGLAAPEKKKVFLSYDFDEDRALKVFMVGQSKLARSPFEIVDTSLKEAAPEARWQQHAARAIGRSDLVMVLLGQHTHRAPGVLAEVAIATAAGKPIVQIQRGGIHRPTPVPGAGRVYVWSWDNLAHILE